MWVKPATSTAAVTLYLECCCSYTSCEYVQRARMIPGVSIVHPRATLQAWSGMYPSGSVHLDLSPAAESRDKIGYLQYTRYIFHDRRSRAGDDFFFAFFVNRQLLTKPQTKNHRTQSPPAPPNNTNLPKFFFVLLFLYKGRAIVLRFVQSEKSSGFQHRLSYKLHLIAGIHTPFGLPSTANICGSLHGLFGQRLRADTNPDAAAALAPSRVWTLLFCCRTCSQQPVHRCRAVALEAARTTDRISHIQTLSVKPSVAFALRCWARLSLSFSLCVCVCVALSRSPTLAWLSHA